MNFTGMRCIAGELKLGDLVRRPSTSPWRLDPFQCHPASFGQVIEFVTECADSRADNPKLRVHGASTWTEVVIAPFDERMSPHGKFWIQWVPNECIKISLFNYAIRALFWPLLRLLYRRPLAGQSTDWWIFKRRKGMD